ncbi:MAG: tRNA (adenosine(37)-N6)-threonylcarbamoyltransferase complex dimerization subunit type 1 TsaB [Proteobacteria bacterium]|nr:tRNA (adenosine(37)-N6)-threonylcarbamoyltransferase complex dimerization subunit type 1 TsaB [Pseudomonadota bacterium]
MALTLAIDSASEACSVALIDGGQLVAGTIRQLGRGHAEALVPMIAALPGKGRADRILIGLGPGSFTGTRIGLAAARALGLAWGVPVLGFPSLALVAAQARAAAGAQAVLVAMTGGHGEWFVEPFDAAGHSAGPLAALRPEVAAADPTALVAGSQAEALVARRGHGEALALWPDARMAGLLGEEHCTAALAPIYGRPPDARLPGGLPAPAPA